MGAELRKKFPGNTEYSAAVSTAQLDVSPASDKGTRSDAVWLAKLADDHFVEVYKTECPYSNPRDIRVWARKQGFEWACGDESDGRSIASRAKKAARPLGAVKAMPALHSTAMRREHPPLHIGQHSTAPCDSCAHASLCRCDAHECQAYANWSALRSWRAEQRTRPQSVSNGQASHRVAAVTTTNIGPAKNEPVSKIAIGDQHENESPAAPRCAVSTIDSASVRDSDSVSIASPAALYETQSALADEEHAANVPREMTVANRDDQHAPGPSRRPISAAELRWQRFFGPRHRSRT